MIVHHLEQNTAEWHAARLGIPTASNFHRIITPTGKKSEQMDEYANELLAEMISGTYDDADFKNNYMDRGHELQEQAAQMYAFKFDVVLTPAGFVTDDARRMGCSPDALVGASGGLEIKCYKPKNHVKQLLSPNIDEKHKPQIQGSIAVIGGAWWDAMSFHPQMQPVIIRAHRDDAYIAQFNRYLTEFHELLSMKKAKLAAMGVEFVL